LFRRTKILATLGPATDDSSVLEKIISAGVDLVRVNFSHGKSSDHETRITSVRNCATALGRKIGILADLQGPKIRIGGFASGPVQLENGQTFVLDSKLEFNAGTQSKVYVEYEQLTQDVFADDVLLLDDGRIELVVKEVNASQVICTVWTGGPLSSGKGLNRRGGGLSAGALTAKDRRDIKTAADLGVDYIAVSFVRDADDIQEARRILEMTGSDAGVIAKIERSEAIADVDNIIRTANGVMVARGDLGVEIGDAEVPAIQKHIIQRAIWLDKPVITATQMMESMIHSPVPTRAEVSDVANAVLEGTDAVMLSGETAVGLHPHKVVDAVVRAVLAAEKQPITQQSGHRLERRFGRVDEAISMSTMYAANHLDIKAIIALTESGSTPLWMSRIRTAIPIFGLSRHRSAIGKMTLFRNVYPLYFDVAAYPREEIKREAVGLLQREGFVEDDDMAIITKGDLDGVNGVTNAMKIVRVGQVF